MKGQEKLHDWSTCLEQEKGRYKGARKKRGLTGDELSTRESHRVCWAGIEMAKGEGTGRQGSEKLYGYQLSFLWCRKSARPISRASRVPYSGYWRSPKCHISGFDWTLFSQKPFWWKYCHLNGACLISDVFPFKFRAAFRVISCFQVFGVVCLIWVCFSCLFLWMSACCFLLVRLWNVLLGLTRCSRIGPGMLKYCVFLLRLFMSIILSGQLKRLQNHVFLKDKPSNYTDSPLEKHTHAQTPTNTAAQGD